MWSISCRYGVSQQAILNHREKSPEKRATRPEDRSQLKGETAGPFQPEEQSQLVLPTPPLAAASSMGPRNRRGSGRPLPAAPREKKAKSLFSRFPNPAEGTVSVNEGKTIAHHVTAVFLPEVRRANEGDLLL